MCCVVREDGGAGGAIAINFDDFPRPEFLGRGERAVPSEARVFFGHCFGPLEVRESSLVHVRMEAPQESDSTVKLTQEESTSNSKPLPISPESRAIRQQLLPPEDIKLRRRKLGKLSWLASPSQRDMCPRFITGVPLGPFHYEERLSSRFSPGVPLRPLRYSVAMFIVIMIWPRQFEFGEEPHC